MVRRPVAGKSKSPRRGRVSTIPRTLTSEQMGAKNRLGRAWNRIQTETGKTTLPKPLAFTDIRQLAGEFEFIRAGSGDQRYESKLVREFNIKTPYIDKVRQRRESTSGWISICYLPSGTSNAMIDALLQAYIRSGGKRVSMDSKGKVTVVSAALPE